MEAHLAKVEAALPGLGFGDFGGYFAMVETT